MLVNPVVPLYFSNNHESKLSYNYIQQMPPKTFKRPTVSQQVNRPKPE